MFYVVSETQIRGQVTNIMKGSNFTLLLVNQNLPSVSTYSDQLLSVGFNLEAITFNNDFITNIAMINPHVVLWGIRDFELEITHHCKFLREHSRVPIIALPEHFVEMEMIVALEIGVDDFLKKESTFRELYARIKNLSRRYLNEQQGKETELLFDELSYEVSINGQSVKLTPVEFRIIKVLYSKKGTAFSRKDLLKMIHTDQRVVNERIIDTNVKNIRKKFNECFRGLKIIDSIYGQGYVFKL